MSRYEWALASTLGIGHRYVAYHGEYRLEVILFYIRLGSDVAPYEVLI